MRDTLGMRPATSEIPDVTCELGRYWVQPPRADIMVNSSHALMSSRTLAALANYSATIPSGVYEGKMWRAQRDGAWWLRWYDVGATPDTCRVETRKVVLA